MKLLLRILIITSIWISLWPWFICAKFNDMHYFSAFDLQLRLIEAIHGDAHSPLLVVRIFHNKVVGTVLDVFRSFITYYDPQFLVSLVGFAGMIFIFLGLYAVLSKSTVKIKVLMLLSLLIFPLVSMLRLFSIPFAGWLVGFGLLTSLLSWYGCDLIPLRCKWYAGVLFLVGITMWWNMVYSPLILGFCLQ